MPRIRALVVSLLPAVLASFAAAASAQAPVNENLQIAPPAIRHVDPPDNTATAEDLENQGDELRRQKLFLDALDYYQAANAKQPNSARLHNKMGMCDLLLDRLHEAQKNFDRSIKDDRQYADAYNNLGVVFYKSKKFSKAISKYREGPSAPC